MWDFLDGKKTILAGVLVTVVQGLVALGVKLPFDPSVATTASVTAALGAAAIIGRLFAKKPGALATPAK